MDPRQHFDFELSLEKSLRKTSWLIPSLSIFTGVLLFSGIAVCLHYYKLSHYWTVLPAGILAHSFFIVIVHDGSHKSITRTKFDRLLMNIGAACMLLPFYGEPFRKFHLLHHGNTNTTLDPLWPKMKKELYDTKRWLYILCEFIPLLFTAYLVFKSNKEKSVQEIKSTKAPKINYYYMVMSFVITGILIYQFQSSLLFCLGTIFCLNILSTIRHWCEHIGNDKKQSSNTFWFPLGMGIGNHETHHHYPRVSWVVLLIGLFYREKNTNPLKIIYGVLFKKSYVHYE